MAEDTEFETSTRNPRFRTSRAPTGYGGSITQGGNLRQSTEAEVSGINGNPSAGTYIAPLPPTPEPEPPEPSWRQKADPLNTGLTENTNAYEKFDPGPVGQTARFERGIESVGDRCFLTEAVMAATGQGDDAMELEVLRMYRDQVLMRSPQGQQLVQQYEQMAPGIVEDINMMPNAQELFAQLFQQFILPVVQAIQSGDHQTALQTYSKMVASAEAMADDAMMKVGYGDVDPAMDGNLGADPAAAAYDGLNAMDATMAPGGMQGGPDPWTAMSGQTGMPRSQPPTGSAAIAMQGMQAIGPPPSQENMAPEPVDYEQDPMHQSDIESTPNPAKRNAIMTVY